MDGLQARCEHMCQMAQRGGRCVYEDRSTLRLLDIDKWTVEMTDEILHYMPNASVDILSCSQSLTGFCVVLRNRPTQHLRAWGWIACMIVFAVVCIRELQMMW